MWRGEKEEHVKDRCPMYDDIRKKYTYLEDDDQLVSFFKEMLDRRDKIDEEDRGERSAQGRGKFYCLMIDASSKEGAHQLILYSMY